MSDVLKAKALQAKLRLQSQFGGRAAPQPPEGFFENPQTGQMTSRELLRNNTETSTLNAAGTGYVQGYSMNLADEAAGLQGEFYRERARATDEAMREAHPVAHTVGQIAGAVTSPVNKVMGPVRTVRGAMTAGGAISAAEGFGKGEGNLENRAKSAFKEGIIGTATAGATTGLFRLPGAVKRAFSTAEKRPSVASLENAKRVAYKAVDNSNERFSSQEMQGLLADVQSELADSNYVEGVDVQTDAMLKLLDRQQGRDMTLGRLDKLRQNLWQRYTKSGNEVGLLDGISAIDKLIDQKAGASEMMGAARLANSRFRKAQMLEDAFEKARLQTSATGSGGNILNKYRQAVTAIVTNPRKAKWFNEEELSIMSSFVEGTNMENTLRRVGKLAPGGNGLMTALNVYAATVDPTMLAVTAAASGAKGAADRTARRGSEDLLDAVATGVIRRPEAKSSIRDLGVGAGVGANALGPY